MADLYNWVEGYHLTRVNI